MVYTEIQKRNNKKYYYRVLSIREKSSVKKKKIYLGRDLVKEDLSKKERQADEKLIVLKSLRKGKGSLEKIKPQIIKILKKNKVIKAGIFGSYARGDEKKKSDIDILIQPPKGIGFGFMGIQFELEDKLKRKVDLITYKSISPYLKERILSEEVKII